MIKLNNTNENIIKFFFHILKNFSLFKNKYIKIYKLIRYIKKNLHPLR